LCIEGFGNEVLLRNGNAKGLVRYDTKNRVTVTECDNLSDSADYSKLFFLKAERLKNSTVLTLSQSSIKSE
jgi:hypothetical protein